MVKRIMNRKELIQLAKELGVRPDWHEPDEQEVSAEVRGNVFDNAGFWGSKYDRLGFYPKTELYVTLYSDGTPVAEVNLATLFAFACGTYEGD